MSKRCLCRCGCFGRCTFNVVFSVIAWSMQALAAGPWPSVDYLKNPLKGWRARKAGEPFDFHSAIIAKCADWAWHKQVLAMRSWQMTFCCWLCEARLGDRDFSLNAIWRHTVHSHSAWLIEMMSGFTSTIFDIPVFSIEYVKVDWMHTVCLGALQYVCGNVMWELFVVVGGTMNKHLAACSILKNMAELQARQLGLEMPFVSLTVLTFRSSMKKKPTMKLKATEGRRFLPVFTAIIQEYFPPSNDYERTRLSCLQALCRCYGEMRNWTVDSPLKLELACRQHLLLYVQLSDATPDGQYKVYPKHHLMVHCCTAVNPTLLWNYADEDEIGQCATMAGKTNVQWLHLYLIERYRIGFKL